MTVFVAFVLIVDQPAAHIQGSLLQTWYNFNLVMDKQSHAK